jgi:hypothetical protein
MAVQLAVGVITVSVYPGLLKSSEASLNVILSEHSKFPNMQRTPEIIALVCIKYCHIYPIGKL